MVPEIEGGDFKCYIHNFQTNSIDQWNAHCSASPMEHSEEGTTICRKCGIFIEFHNLPFHPIQEDGSKGISLMCVDCSAKIIK